MEVKEVAAAEGGKEKVFLILPTFLGRMIQ